MYLVQLLLPVTDNEGNDFPEQVMRDVQTELCERFGGLTAYSRAPAKGIWAHDGARQKDDIATVEVMADELDEDWWVDFRKRLEKLLGQEELVIRAHEIRKL
jgi:hypothetical protein